MLSPMGRSGVRRHVPGRLICFLRGEEMVLEQHVQAAEQRRSWFVHDRFGLFIHWGLYALPARHEWVKNREKLTDEHYQEFPVDGLHPQRDDLAFREQAKNRDVSKYAAYLHGQVRELLTNYGPIDIMWFDFSYSGGDWGWSKGKGKDDWQSEPLMQLV